MQLQKKCIAALVCTLLCCLLLPLTVFAHPGRTDSQGGHYDHQNGGYHYHHGYPAHDHPGGVCPYETDVQAVEEDDDPDVPVYENKHAYEGDQEESDKPINRKQVGKNNDSEDASSIIPAVMIITLLLSPFYVGGIIIHIRLRRKSGLVKAHSDQQAQHHSLDTFSLLLPGVAIVAAIILILVLLYFS